MYISEKMKRIFSIVAGIEKIAFSIFEGKMETKMGLNLFIKK